MPIYAYRCADCGHQKDVLQKMSDAPLTQCPACGKDTFSKQVTAAGFQLKGSGWYVTDFRGGKSAANGANGGNGAPDAPAAKSDDASSSSASTASTDSASKAAPSSDAGKPAADSSSASSAA